MQIICPKCLIEYEIDQSSIGRIVQCVCGHKWLAEIPSHIWQYIRSFSDMVNADNISAAEARNKIKDWLWDQKYQSYEQFYSNKISNLSSTARLNLILSYNADRLQAAKVYQVGMDPSVIEWFPAWEYCCFSDDHVRSNHAQYNGMIFAKNDPIWKIIFPPWELGCRCWVKNVSRKEWSEYQKQAIAKIDPPMIKNDNVILNVKDLFFDDCGMQLSQMTESEREYLEHGYYRVI